MDRNWPGFYIHIAEQVAAQSSCVRRKVGAVLVKHNGIIATGYNGALTGMTECDEHFGHAAPSRDAHKTWTALHEIHAEQNVLIDVCKRCTWEPDMTLYITCLPCPTCALSLITAGISTIIYTGESAQDNRAIYLFNEAGINLYKYVGDADVSNRLQAVELQ